MNFHGLMCIIMFCDYKIGLVVHLVCNPTFIAREGMSWNIFIKEYQRFMMGKSRRDVSELVLMGIKANNDP